MVSCFCEPLGVRTQDFQNLESSTTRCYNQHFANGRPSELWRYCGICHANKLIYYPALLALLTGNYIK